MEVNGGQAQKADRKITPRILPFYGLPKAFYTPKMIGISEVKCFLANRLGLQ